MADIFKEDNFDQEVLQSDIPVLVDFYADWCSPCKMMAPIVEEIGEEYKGKVKVGKLNIDDNMKIAQKYNIMTIPTLTVFKNGEPVQSFSGVRSKDDLRNMSDNA